MSLWGEERCKGILSCLKYKRNFILFKIMIEKITSVWYNSNRKEATAHKVVSLV